MVLESKSMKAIVEKKLNIAILGAGAMGSLFGGYLSRRNNVFMIDTSQQVIDYITGHGISITEPNGIEETYSVSAARTVNAFGSLKADLVIVFVKGMYSADALRAVVPIISNSTYLLSLQNGIGHEEVLRQFVAPENILIGTTQHNSATLSVGRVKHGGSGLTRIGRFSGPDVDVEHIIANFNACCMVNELANAYKELAREKLVSNVFASVLTGVLQVPLGFIIANEWAWSLCRELILEAVEVAGCDGVFFDVDAEIEKVKMVCTNSPQGLTSIYSDLAHGRKSEVDTISGGVVRLARMYHVSVPHHEMIVKIIHALEGKANHESIGGV